MTPGPGGRFLWQDGTVAERHIRLFGDPVLRTPCDAVEVFDVALFRLVADLEETVSLPGRAGLAASQIGVSRRAFAYHVDGQAGYVVNPVIEAIEGEQEGEEGCLSIPELWYPLRRARYARVTGVDRSRQPIEVLVLAGAAAQAHDRRAITWAADVAQPDPRHRRLLHRPSPVPGGGVKVSP